MKITCFYVAHWETDKNGSHLEISQFFFKSKIKGTVLCLSPDLKYFAESGHSSSNIPTLVLTTTSVCSELNSFY